MEASRLRAGQQDPTAFSSSEGSLPDRRGQLAAQGIAWFVSVAIG
jgi:hypothetical protein